jgi:hypothetical protein
MLIRGTDTRYVSLNRVYISEPSVRNRTLHNDSHKKMRGKNNFFILLQRVNNEGLVLTRLFIFKSHNLCI